MTTVAEIIALAAKAASIPPSLLLAVCSVESDLRPNVVNQYDGNSPSYGVCQVKAETAKMLKWSSKRSDLLNPNHNALVAAHYLRYQLNRYPGNYACVVAAYNAGSCNINTQGYIRNSKYLKKIRARIKRFEAVYGHVNLDYPKKVKHTTNNSNEQKSKKSKPPAKPESRGIHVDFRPAGELLRPT